MGKKNKKDKASKAEKKAAKQAKKLEGKPVKTGKGETPAEVAAELVRMFNDGQWSEIEEKFWSPKITSVEGVGVAKAWKGRKAVDAKNKAWLDTHTIHSARAEGPFVGASGFAVRYSMEIEDKGNGQRTKMEEVGVYEVKDGKIVREEFMYRT